MLPVGNIFYIFIQSFLHQRAIPVRIGAAKTLVVLSRHLRYKEQRDEVMAMLKEGQLLALIFYLITISYSPSTLTIHFVILIAVFKYYFVSSYFRFYCISIS